MNNVIFIQKLARGISVSVDISDKSLVVLKADLNGDSEYFTLALNKNRVIDYPSDLFKLGALSGVVFPCPPTLREDFVYYYNARGVDSGIYGLNHVDPGKYPLGRDQGAWRLK